MIPRKLKLLLSLLRSLPGELVYARQAAAYRRYLTSQFPDTVFGPGCMASGDCHFGEGVWVGGGTRLSDCTIGRYSYVSGNAQVSDCEIGSFCSVGPEVLIGLSVHPLDYISTYPGFYAPERVSCRTNLVNAKKIQIVEQAPIRIGNDVWIGARAIVLGGIQVGDGAVIGAGAVVTKNVAPYEIVGGVPARLIRQRFSDEIVAKLLDLRWWDKPLEWIDVHAPDFLDPEVFLHKLALERQ